MRALARAKCWPRLRVWSLLRSHSKRVDASHGTLAPNAPALDPAGERLIDPLACRWPCVEPSWTDRGAVVDSQMWKAIGSTPLPLLLSSHSVAGPATSGPSLCEMTVGNRQSHSPQSPIVGDGRASAESAGTRPAAPLTSMKPSVARHLVVSPQTSVVLPSSGKYLLGWALMAPSARGQHRRGD